MAKAGIGALFLILEETVSVLNLKNKVSCGFFIYSLYYVEVVALYAYFLEYFISFGLLICKNRRLNEVTHSA